MVAELGHPAESTFAHCRQIHRGGECHQGFVGADIGGRPLPSYMLFAGGRSEHVAGLTFNISGVANNPAGHLAQVLFAAGEDTQARPTKAHRVAQWLSLGDGNTGAIAPRRLKKAK